ncbi:MAG TPA: aminopeptidase P N-terminal domain-containing protein [Gammaproteobacteria bacterium]|nr:aminopeptidase P N-terminal domain-containing protein [Gammaproteobacteria bacterium]
MDTAIHAQRRERLMTQMEGGVAILPNAAVTLRNRDVEHPFRANSDFLYLTGFTEPDAVAVLIPDHPEHRYLLFVPPKDPEKEVWTGIRAGVEGAKRDFGADEAYPLDQLDDILPGLLADRERLYVHFGREPAFDAKVTRWLNATRAKERQGVRAPEELVDVEHLLHEMRLVKGPEELARMREAAAITAEAHRRAQEVCRPGMHEYQVQAEMEYLFHYRGAERPAYPSIVAGGAHACILHYTENRAPLNDGDLLLIDAGCEVDGYAADVTRTFPVGDSVTGAQREVWDVVLAAQQAAIDQVRPGRSFDDYHQAALRVLVQGMVDLGLLAGEVDGLIERGEFRDFFMHRTGHWLGLDVHDVGRYKVAADHWRTLEPGMVLTVEPGLYIPPDAEDVRPELRGIGVRLEDDIHVTDGEPENLTAAAPKERP